VNIESLTELSNASERRVYIPNIGPFLFLNLFVGCLNTAPLTPLLELYFTLNKLLILGRPIVYTLTFSAGEFDESIL